MLEIYNYNEFQLLAFFLVLLRISAFIVAWPVFGVPSVPAPVKVLFSLVLTMMIFPTVSAEELGLKMLENQIILVAIKEVFIGLTFGFLAKMFFFAIRISGEIVSVSMGLSSSQLFNPSLGGRASSIEQFKLVIASLFFLSVNGHHLLLTGLFDTFRILPLNPEMLNLTGLQSMGTFAQEIMVIGLKISSPVLISIFFMNMTMAIIGRTVPQINVLITSLPVNILAGFIVMLVSVPLMVWQMNDLLEITADRLFMLVKTF